VFYAKHFELVFSIKKMVALLDFATFLHFFIRVVRSILKLRIGKSLPKQNLWEGPFQRCNYLRSLVPILKIVCGCHRAKLPLRANTTQISHGEVSVAPPLPSRPHPQSPQLESCERNCSVMNDPG
jgi:hypothetical protein